MQTVTFIKTGQRKIVLVRARVINMVCPLGNLCSVELSIDVNVTLSVLQKGMEKLTVKRRSLLHLHMPTTLLSFIDTCSYGYKSVNYFTIY